MNIDKLKLKGVFETAGIKNAEELVSTVEELIDLDNTALETKHKKQLEELEKSHLNAIVEIKEELSKEHSSLIESNIVALEEQQRTSKELLSAVTEENSVLKAKVEEFESVKESLVEFTLNEAEKDFNSQLEMFFKQVAEEWVKENDNELDIIAESAVSDIASITISEALNNAGFTLSADKESIATTLTDLQEELRIATEENVILVNAMREIQKEVLIEESVQGLTDIDADKVRLVAENIKYNDKESFNKALQFMQDSIKTKSETVEPIQESLIEVEDINESVDRTHEDLVKATLALYS
jgi:hypothetical protein